MLKTSLAIDVTKNTRTLNQDDVRNYIAQHVNSELLYCMDKTDHLMRLPLSDHEIDNDVLLLSSSSTGWGGAYGIPTRQSVDHNFAPLLFVAFPFCVVTPVMV